MDNTYTTYTTTYSTTSDAAAAGVGLVFMLFAFLFAIAYYVIIGIFLGRIFKKAGTPAWIAWVPFYNVWRLLEIGGQPGYWAVLSIIPLVNIASAVFMYIAMYHVGKKLGKDDIFILWAIFIPIVWFVWLGLDDSKWDESKGAKRLDTPLTATDSTPADTTSPKV